MPDTPVDTTQPQPDAATTQPQPVTTDASAQPATPSAAVINPARSLARTVLSGNARPVQRQTFGEGAKEGAAGQHYITDAQGNLQPANQKPASLRSILGMALLGAGKGFGAGLTAGKDETGGEAAGKMAQQQDATNRNTAQQNFKNQQEVKTQDREQLESQARISLSNAQSARFTTETRILNDKEPLELSTMQAAALKDRLDTITKTEAITGGSGQALQTWAGPKDFLSDPDAAKAVASGQDIILPTLVDGKPAYGLFDKGFEKQVLSEDQELFLKPFYNPKTHQIEKGEATHLRANSSTTNGDYLALQAKADVAMDKQRDAWDKNEVTPKDRFLAQQRLAVAEMGKQATTLSGLQAKGAERMLNASTKDKGNYAAFAEENQGFRSTLNAAATGDQVASNFAKTMGIQGVNELAGLTRISPTEYTAMDEVGSIQRQIWAKLSKARSGQLPPDTIKELTAMADRLRDAKYRSYVASQKLIATTMKMDPDTMIFAQDGQSQVPLSEALKITGAGPKAGGPPAPAGATGEVKVGGNVVGHVVNNKFVPLGK